MPSPSGSRCVAIAIRLLLFIVFTNFVNECIDFFPVFKTVINLEFDIGQVFYSNPVSQCRAYVPFCAVKGGEPRLYTFDLDNGHIEALHTGALEYGGFAWSPDGGSIAFSTIAPRSIDSLEVFWRVDPHTRPGRDIYLLRVEDGFTRSITF